MAFPSILQRSTSLSGRGGRSLDFGGSNVAVLLVADELLEVEDEVGYLYPFAKVAVWSRCRKTRVGYSGLSGADIIVSLNNLASLKSSAKISSQ